jgi:hypothetical protein
MGPEVDRGLQFQSNLTSLSNQLLMPIRDGCQILLDNNELKHMVTPSISSDEIKST